MDAIENTAERPGHGAKILSLTGRVTLYDPDPAVESTSEPDEPAVQEIEETIKRAVGELGYFVTVELTRSGR